jgi:prephenate dehydratase
MSDPALTIAFQGAPGAYSDLACRTAQPTMTTLPCATFEEAFAAVREGRASLAMIPIDNSVAGRVADIHHLLPDSGLHIVGEHFQKVVHHLLAPKGATIAGLKTVHSHVHALPQCRHIIAELGLKAIVHADTAGAAADVAARNDRSESAIASELAGQIYGLVSLRADVADLKDNTTRFVIMRREPLAAYPPRFTRRWAALPPTASTSPSWKATSSTAASPWRSSMPTSTGIRTSARCAWRWRSSASSPARCASWASIRRARRAGDPK